jgi:hypothetical protein
MASTVRDLAVAMDMNSPRTGRRREVSASEVSTRTGNRRESDLTTKHPRFRITVVGGPSTSFPVQIRSILHNVLV